jgi:hypothetical protein
VQYFLKIKYCFHNAVFVKNECFGLFKNVQMQGAEKAEPRGVYRHTLSGAV